MIRLFCPDGWDAADAGLGFRIPDGIMRDDAGFPIFLWLLWSAECGVRSAEPSRFSVR